MTDMTNPVTIEFDVAGDSPIQMVLETISTFSGKVDDIIAHGPGGGNPCLTATFPSRTIATDFLLEIGVDPDDLDIYFE